MARKRPITGRQKLAIRQCNDRMMVGPPKAHRGKSLPAQMVLMGPNTRWGHRTGALIPTVLLPRLRLGRKTTYRIAMPERNAAADAPDAERSDRRNSISTSNRPMRRISARPTCRVRMAAHPPPPLQPKMADPALRSTRKAPGPTTGGRIRIDQQKRKAENTGSPVATGAMHRSMRRLTWAPTIAGFWSRCRPGPDSFGSSTRFHGSCGLGKGSVPPGVCRMARWTGRWTH